MGIEAPCICTKETRDRLAACSALWAFDHVLDLAQEWKEQQLSWVILFNRIRAGRDAFQRVDPGAYPIQPKPVAEFIPAVALFSTSNGNKTRLDKCKAILDDPQHVEFHGAIRTARMFILEKRDLPTHLVNMIERLYAICRD